MVFDGINVAVGVELGVGVNVGVNVGVAVSVAVGVQVAGRAKATTAVEVGSGGLNGFMATYGLTKINA